MTHAEASKIIDVRFRASKHIEEIICTMQTALNLNKSSTQRFIFEFGIASVFSLASQFQNLNDLKTATPREINLFRQLMLMVFETQSYRDKYFSTIVEDFRKEISAERRQ